MATATSIQVDHLAMCPEISPPDCSEDSIPDHMHHQGIQWLRTSLGVSLGLGKGWQLRTDIPLDLKLLTIDYSLDGEPYSPSYGGIHHRNETLFGLSDPKVFVQRFQGLPKDFVLGLHLGSSLPLGRTEENPFALAAQGKWHQHFQRGTGTFVPSGRMELFWMGLRWRAMGWFNGTLPLYPSTEGYQPGRSLSYGLTGVYRLTPETQLLALAEAAHLSADTWDGDASSTPGRDLAVFGVGGLHMLSPGLVLQGQVRVTAWQQTRALVPEDELVQRFLLTLGLSWSPGMDSHAH